MNKSRLRREIIKELYGTSLRFLYEQDPPADPATPDPAAPPMPDPMAAAPAIPGAPPVPGAPAAAPVKKPVVHADIKTAIGRYLEKAEQKAIEESAKKFERGQIPLKSYKQTYSLTLTK